MTPEKATLVAAIAAAIASILGVIIALRANMRAEFRLALRQTLEPSLSQLADALHQTVACSNILLKAESDEKRKKWKDNGAKAASVIKRLRPRLRYPLWGIDEGLRVMSRIPDWADHARANAEKADELLNAADSLRNALDNAVRHSYSKGRTPNLYERCRVRRAADKCRSCFRMRDDREIELDE